MPTTPAERATIRERLARDEAAEQRAAERARLDHADRQAQIVEANDFVQSERDQWWAERDAGRRDMQQRQAQLEAMVLPPAPISPALTAAELAQATAVSAGWDAQERDEAWKTVQADEERKVVQPGWRDAYLRLHPGGLDSCACFGHRLMRREV